jgi:SAM-dependent methyltransferase
MATGTVLMSWEEAVRWYRAQPGNEAAIRANYFDLPVRTAAERYAASEEFAEVLRILGRSGRTLDLGAGNGIASFAFARAGWNVTAVEPDPSDEVGAGAIRELAEQASRLSQSGRIAEIADSLPRTASAFDAIFARQVLHHVPDLRETMLDAFRLLRPGGAMLAIREHVVSDANELARFLAAHPLHAHYGGENAHALEAYLAAARNAGFVIECVWGPIESILNFHPGTEAERVAHIRRLAAGRAGLLGRLLVRLPGYVARVVPAITAADRTPGRIYSFLFRKE